jgi:hypothetical protein
MANFIVLSPSQSTTGGNSGDLFSFNSGAVSGSTLVGGTGADTVEILAGGRAASGASFKLGGGADQFRVSGTTISAAIAGGAGGDTVTFSGANSVGNLGLGAGSDRVEVKGALAMQGGGSIKAGKGADIISGNSNSDFSGASLLMGAGKDTITLSADAGGLQSANFVGGGGADVFNVVGNAFDTTVKGGAGGDTIGLTGNFDSATLQLGNGSDVLRLVGDVSDTGAILGGKGADVLNFSASTFTTVSGFTVGGGAGNDTISFDTVVASAGFGLDVVGGGGNDSISFNQDAAVADGAALSAGAAAFSAGNTYASIHGGAGADSITFTGAITTSAGIAGVITWDETSDSTLTTQDVITFTKSAGEDAGLLMDFGGTIGTSVGSGQSVTKDGLSTNSAGFLVSAGSNSSVAERASAMDSLLSTGQIGVFKDASGSAAYLFVQGGTTDLVAKFDISGASAGVVLLSATGGAGAFKLQFDGPGGNG